MIKKRERPATPLVGSLLWAVSADVAFLVAVLSEGREKRMSVKLI